MDTPTRIGKYVLKRKLAVGGMAEIWLAEQTGPAGFAKRLVVKQILPHLADDSKFVEMFLDEARLAAQLEHPNIVRISDLGEADGKYFIAMEYIDGPDLDYIVEKCNELGTKVPFHIAARIMADTLGGLEYAHNFADPNGVPMGLVHRDISPHNILVNAAGVSKLVDFGVAKAASSTHKTQTGAIKGKFAYMSPEQIANNALDGRSDVFAMGIVLYELTTGKRPFGEEGDLMAVTAILTKHPTDPREFVSDFPGEMHDIILKALAKERDERYPTARAMREDLERYLQSRGLFVTSADVGDFLKQLEDGNVSHEIPEGSQGTATSRPFTQPEVPVPRPNSTPPEPQLLSQPHTTSGFASPPTVQTPDPPPYVPDAPAPSSGSNKGLLIAGVGLLAFILVVGGVAAALFLGSSGDSEKKEKDAKVTKNEPKKNNEKTEKKPEKKTEKRKVIFNIAEPNKTQVFMNGKSLSNGGIIAKANIEVGKHTFTFKHPSGVELEKKIEIKGGKKPQDIPFHWEYGMLTVQVQPEGEYTIYVNGKEKKDALKKPFEIVANVDNEVKAKVKDGKAFDVKKAKVKADGETIVKLNVKK